jgi:hypothetical protein
MNSFVWSVLLGISMKLYDDWIDLKITQFPLLLDICKIMMVITTYLLMNEYYIFNLAGMGSLLLSNSIKRFDDPFWDAYLVFVAGLAIMNISQLPTIWKDWQIKLGLVCYIYLSSYVEETTYFEEISNDKMVARGYGIIINTCILLILEYFNVIDKYELDFFVSLILFINSYLITSILVQISYATYHLKTPNQPLPQPAVEPSTTQECVCKEETPCLGIK